MWTISYMSIADFLFLYGAPIVAVAKMLEIDIITTMLFTLISAVAEQMKLV